MSFNIVAIFVCKLVPVPNPVMSSVVDITSVLTLVSTYAFVATSWVAVGSATPIF